LTTNRQAGNPLRRLEREMGVITDASAALALLFVCRAQMTVLFVLQSRWRGHFVRSRPLLSLVLLVLVLLLLLGITQAGKQQWHVIPYLKCCWHAGGNLFDRRLATKSPEDEPEQPTTTQCLLDAFNADTGLTSVGPVLDDTAVVVAYRDEKTVREWRAFLPTICGVRPDLWSMKSPQELEVALQLVSVDTAYWLGGQRVGDGTFRWFDGTAIDDEAGDNWITFPGTTTGKCLVLWNGK